MEYGNSNSNGAGIGGGANGNGGKITINGGEITATATATSENGDSYSNGAGIGGGDKGNGGHITINGGEVTATATSENGNSNSNGAGIGGGAGKDGGDITINGGEVEATATATSENGNSNSIGAGIGGGAGGDGGKITINGGVVEATATATSENGDSCSEGAGIGGGARGSNGDSGNGGSITINGGKIKATATATATSGQGDYFSYGAGIGGGNCGNGGSITINGGEIIATSENGNSYSKGAGIGGGYYADGGNIIITGGNITASGGTNCEGIGRGTLNSEGTNGSGTLTLGDDVVLYGSDEELDVLPNDDKIINAEPGSNSPSYRRERYMKAITYIKTVKLTLTKPSIGTTISIEDDGQGGVVQQPKPDVSLEENANYTINEKLWYDTLPTDPNDLTSTQPMNGTIHAGKYYVGVNLYPREGFLFKENTLPDVYLNGASVSVPYGSSRGAERCTVFIPVTITAPPVEQTAPPVEQYCTITYDSNGGTGSMEVQKVKKGSQISVDDCGFEKKGYVFVSWNTQQDGTGTSYDGGQLLNLNSNLYLYAQWKKLSIVDAKISLNPKSCKYDGKAHTVNVTSVVLNGKKLISGTDYMAPNVKVREVKEYEIVVTGIGDYAGEKIIKYKVLKGDNTLITVDANRTARCKVNASTKKTSDSVKVSGVKIKNIGQGNITFKKVSVNKDAGKFKVDKNTGKITVRNRTKIGTYKVTVSAQAAGNKNYNKSKVQNRVVKITLKSK